MIILCVFCTISNVLCILLLLRLMLILAGDFNQLADDDVAEKTGLLQIVQKPTRDQNVLDRIFVSCPLYSTIRVATSVVRSDHKAVVAYMLSNLSLLLKPLLPRPLDQSHRRNMLRFCTVFQPLFSQRLVSLLPVMYKPNLMYFMTLLYDSLITFIRSIPSQLHLGTPAISLRILRQSCARRIG